jgi:putative spermidine/putrescine transport system ATP-binding protein
MMVAGLQQPDVGTILLNGVSVARLPPYRRDIGMVFQSYALFPHMTVRRNVAFPLEMRGLAKAEIGRLVEEALALVKLPDHGDRLPKQLSGGQQQRVALARAMVYRPALLLMDEPLGALDKKLREQLQLEIKRVHRERGISVLYVTHDQEEALTMSDRIAVFNRGRIEQIGTPEELYDRPATRFVASFIGNTNFLPGHLLGKAGVTVAVRPERIVMGPPREGALAGTITDVIFLGTARKYVVRLVDGTECTVLRQVSDPAFDSRGAAVALSWHRDHATAFPDNEV